jgi:hypothetical protein
MLLIKLIFNNFFCSEHEFTSADSNGDDIVSNGEQSSVNSGVKFHVLLTSYEATLAALLH